jgi:hypothetical protein
MSSIGSADAHARELAEALLKDYKDDYLLSIALLLLSFCCVALLYVRIYSTFYMSDFIGN